MTDLEAILARHSVRDYLPQPIADEAVAALKKDIQLANKVSGLRMQLIVEDPEAFDDMKAHYGKVTGVKNYIALVGKQSPELDERCGYYGQALVLLAQKLGLNTCWVGLSYSKRKAKRQVRIGRDERMPLVIALGYGSSQGTARKTKSIEALSKVEGPMPTWFHQGMQAAQLAPTAMNQQRFQIELVGQEKAHARALPGFYSKVDLGIVKRHFEIGSGRGSEVWV